MSAAVEELFPLVINYDDPHKEDIVTLLNDHLLFCRSTSPPEFVYALDVEALCTPDIAFYAGRVPVSDQVMVVAALRILDEKHGELKSMHTLRSVRGRGYGKSMLRHVMPGNADWSGSASRPVPWSSFLRQGSCTIPLVSLNAMCLDTMNQASTAYA